MILIQLKQIETVWCTSQLLYYYHFNNCNLVMLGWSATKRITFSWMYYCFSPTKVRGCYSLLKKVSIIDTDYYSFSSRITVKGNSYCFDPETSDSCSPLPLGEAGYYVLNLNSIARAASFHTTLTTDTDVRLQFRVYTGGEYRIWHITVKSGLEAGSYTIGRLQFVIQ